MNKYSSKQTKYAMELFETSSLHKSVPHKQIIIEREVEDFYGAIWEPNNAKLAIHTYSRKVIEPGQKNFSNETHRKGIDMYQMLNDKNLGFLVKKIGGPSHEKILNLYFSS